MWNTNPLGLSIPIFPGAALPTLGRLSEREIFAEISSRLESGQRSLTASMARKAAEDKRLLREKLSEEEAFSITYVPFSIAEVAWDYVDSIFNFVQYMRLEETKKLCRSIRELRREYDRKRFKVIDDSMRQSEISNAILFQEELKDFFGAMHKKFNDSMRVSFPDLDYDHVMMLSAVYGCDTVLDALFHYAALQQYKVSAILGYEIAPILPQELKTLRSCVSKFYGSYTPSDKTLNGSWQWVEELVQYMNDISINET